MSNCKKCGGPIKWIQINDRWQCRELDGKTDHWGICAERRFKAIKAQGVLFETPTVSGYRTPQRTQLTRIAAPEPMGKIDTAGCRQCVPAWEVCPNACPIAF